MVKPTMRRVKVAVTVLAAFMVIVQAPAPVQAPDQPVKEELALGTVAIATTVPLGYVLLQGKVVQVVSPMPMADRTTLPPPIPDLFTVKP